MSSITIEQYSEKAIVVRGNTVPYKENLLSIGGKWNKMLKGGEGWIFPLTKKPIVEKLLSEPPTNNGDNSDNENQQTKRTVKSTYERKTNDNGNSNDIVLSKKEYLHLISRIERLEQLVAKISDSDDIPQKETKKKNIKKSQIPPPLSSISDADLCEPINCDNIVECEAEREPVQRFLKRKN